ncbi:hypothetical protein A5482_016085 (plasmid) [Cyanobacterium sp. IPPAS B-1200]|uniref:hypothetical protein n=1 Tax=Cyanobacterium sp. IPPAS B-1200 TaxID=1562720 RepID=UPI0008526FFA|nr:hypothetical protein [Cyanobacterium sp. IPPAS B-1200]OEJ80046.1 hypothetical protein A5482_07880 [Cyanobacterium sp. IPPAS B-1200]
MGEYQYYEFQAIERGLTKVEQQEISRLSSRVGLTSRKAIFRYSYGDFPANEKQILAEYFDALFYMANWGTVKLMFKFPISLVDPQELAEYIYSDVISIKKTKNHLILNIEINDEERCEWIEEDSNYLDDLINLRTQILERDYRVLYLAWLKAIELDEKKLIQSKEPPLPHGLKELSESHKIFIELFEVNKYLIEVASINSPKINPIQDNILEKNITKLSNSEKDDFLLRLLKEEANLSLKLKQKLSAFNESVNQQSSPEKRTIKWLLTEAQKAKQLEQERQAEEIRQKNIRELKAFASREDDAWQEVDNLIQKGQPKPYDEAKKLLIKLKELAIYQGKEAIFSQRLEDIKTKYSRKKTFIQRINHL